MTIPTRFLRISTGIAFTALVGLAMPVIASAHAVAGCTVPAGLASLFQPGKLILMGEVHGTAETPAAFDAAVCNALERGHAVSVGLELGPDQVEPLAAISPRMAASLQSRSCWIPRSGRAPSRTAARVWPCSVIEQLRLAKQRSPNLNVFVLEEGVAAGAAFGMTGDERMAARVRAERRRRPEAIVLTLTGNVHNRLQAMPPMPDGRRLPTPMGVLLSDLSPVSVLVATTSGTAWVCTPECGVTAWPAPGTAPVGSLPAYREQPQAAAYTGEWWLGPSTASVPAVQSGR